MESLIKSIASLKNGIGSLKRKDAASSKGAFSLSLLFLDLLAAAVSALLASFAPFEGISPFGAACVLAAWYSGADPYFAAIGAAIGHAVSGSFAWSAITLLMGVFIFVVESKVRVRKVFRLLWGFAAECAFILPVSLISGTRLFLNLGSATVSVLGGVVLGCGLHALTKERCGRALSDTELLTLAASLGLITLSMRSFRLFGQSPAMVFAGVCALLFAHRLGPSSVALAVAVAAGRVLATGGDLHFIAVLAALAFIASSVRVFGKWLCLAAFFGLSALFWKLIGGPGVFSLPETLAVCAVFAAIPKPAAQRKGPDIVALPKAAPSGYGKLQFRVATLSDVLKELARVCGGDEGRLLLAVSGTLRRSLNRGSEKSESLKVEYSYAKSTASGSEFSGDSCSVVSSEGRLLMALSDGMGSGEAAMKESRSALALLSDLVFVGFELGEAAKCVNGLMTREENGDMYATLDALLLDLRDGEGVISKNGAPSSYVLRGGKVFTLYSEALPIGIIESSGGGEKTVRLKAGDAVIMMTDGVSDALGTGLHAAIRDSAAGKNDPEALAGALLKEAEKRGKKDDMTVLVAKLSEKKCA